MFIDISLYADEVTESRALCCPPLSTATISPSEADALATKLRALADPTRLRLLNIVAMSGEACACDFPAAVGRSQPTVSHHLTQLVEAGILIREQRGRWAWFRIDPAGMTAVRAALA